MKISPQDVLDLHNQDLNDYEIGAKLGCSHSHVKQIRVHHLGIPSLQARQAAEKLALVKQLYEQGLNDREIKETTGFSISTVQHYRKNLLKLAAKFEENVYETEEDRIRGYIIRNVKFSAKRRNIEFNITFRDFSLPEFCPLLGIRLTYRGSGDFNSNERATLDRIDNTKGYVKGNVWIISRLANAMKNEATLTQLETFCQNVSHMLENQRARGGITDSESLDP